MALLDPISGTILMRAYRTGEKDYVYRDGLANLGAFLGVMADLPRARFLDTVPPLSGRIGATRPDVPMSPHVAGNMTDAFGIPLPPTMGTMVTGVLMCFGLPKLSV